MFDDCGRGRDAFVPDSTPGAWTDPGVSGVMLTRLPPGKPRDFGELPGLDPRLEERSTRAWIEGADIVDAVGRATGRRRLLHGDPATESRPYDPDRPRTPPAVVTFWVDRQTDELESLVRPVRRIKRSYRFAEDLRKIFGETEIVEEPGAADFIDAVGGASAESVGLSYVDPTTGSLPICCLEPWLAPTVMLVRVDPLSRDRVALSEATQGIRGSYGGAADG